MHTLFAILTVLAAFAATEGLAWLTHRYLMHGPLWSWHHSHHHPPRTKLQKNDLFTVLFSLLGMTLFGAGWLLSPWFLYLGMGVALYGIAYFLVHDAFVHRRVPFLPRRSKYNYFEAMRRAHHAHHAHTEKEGGEAFGFLFVPKRYFKARNRR